MSDNAERKLSVTNVCVPNCRSGREKCEGEGERNRCNALNPSMGAECNYNLLAE